MTADAAVYVTPAAMDDLPWTRQEADDARGRLYALLPSGKWVWTTLGPAKLPR